jgi:hypothetical protein
MEKNNQVKPFNWQEYVNLSPPPKLGLGRENETQFYAEAHKKMEEALDRISKFPEVQKLLKDGLQLQKQRHPEKPDGRVAIYLSHTSLIGEYLKDAHKIRIDALGLLGTKFPRQDGSMTASSLDEVIIHEFHHAADKNDTNVNELKNNKQAATIAIQMLLKNYPQYQQDKNTGKIADLPFNDLLASKTPEEFEKIKRDYLYPLARAGDKAISKIMDFFYSDDPKEAAKIYFTHIFEKEMQTINDNQYEMPAVASTNAIMEKYYVFSPRNVYAGVSSSDSRYDFPDPDSNFSTFIPELASLQATPKNQQTRALDTITIPDSVRECMTKHGMKECGDDRASNPPHNMDNTPGKSRQELTR